MGTPDDLEEFRGCQQGYEARDMRWNDMSRGAAHWMEGPDDYAKGVGMDTIASGVKPEDEGLYVHHHKHWIEEMLNAIELERASHIPVIQKD
jgi:benzoate/toluate 1,2-dioxygenase alpha subunit